LRVRCRGRSRRIRVGGVRWGGCRVYVCEDPKGEKIYALSEPFVGVVGAFRSDPKRRAKGTAAAREAPCKGGDRCRESALRRKAGGSAHREGRAMKKETAVGAYRVKDKKKVLCSRARALGRPNNHRGKPRVAQEQRICRANPKRWKVEGG